MHHVLTDKKATFGEMLVERIVSIQVQKPHVEALPNRPATYLQLFHQIRYFHTVRASMIFTV